MKQRKVKNSLPILPFDRETLHAPRFTLCRWLTFHVSRFTFHDRRGQFLIEAIVAGSVLIMGFTGIMALLARAMHANRIITNNYIGTYLAAEGIEIVKNIIDHNVMMRMGGVDWCDPDILPRSGWSWVRDVLAGPREVDYTSNNVRDVATGSGRTQGRRLRFDRNTYRYGYDSGDSTPFRRVVWIQPGSDQVEIASRVTWDTGLLESEVELVDVLWDWRQ